MPMYTNIARAFVRFQQKSHEVLDKQIKHLSTLVLSEIDSMVR